MSLQITTEPLENRQLSVAIEVDQQRVDGELRKAARKLAREVRIPGFRKGKAPYNIILQFLGPQALYNEFLDKLGQQVFSEAIEQEGIEPYAQASLDDIGFEPLTYKLTVPLEPEIDLGDYRSVRVEEKPVEVDEEAITERLEGYRTQYAGWKETDRPSQFGDMMNIDVRSVIAAESEDEEETVVLDETDWDVTPDEENPMEPPGFDAALLGMAPGDEKTFELAWPDDSQSIYAGKTATFNVTLNSNQAYEKPELDDEFAQLVGPDFETLDDLMANIRETLQEQAQTAADNAYLDNAFNAVQEQATLVYPPVVIEDQIDSMVNDLRQRLRQYGIEDVDGYFEQTGQSMEEYRDSIREQATVIAERNLIISELWKVEQIEVEDEDIEAKISEIIGDIAEPDGSEELDVELDELELDEPDLSDEDSSVEEDDETEGADDEDADLADFDGEVELDQSDLSEGDAPDADSDEADATAGFAEMFRSGGGRSILEAQILQEKSIERLLAIVRDEEVPDLVAIEETDEDHAAEEAVEGDDADVDETVDASDDLEAAEETR